VNPPLNYRSVISLVRARIADGALRPGAPAPSAASLARELGCNEMTARRAVRALLDDGTLVPGPSRGARPRVALPAGARTPDAEVLARQLSALLGDLRRAAGLTQPELAAKLRVSLTTVGHAETSRLWQARRFWERADEVLGGGLLELYDRHSAARAMTREQDDEEPPPPVPAVETSAVLPARVAITADGVEVTWPDSSSVLLRPPDTAASTSSQVSPNLV
jgi:Bacterial regulatory proteins, gntR family/Helix-turn-helix domain